MHIIPFFPATYRFAVYEHRIQNQKELSTYRMIVIKNSDNRIVYYTGLELFSYPYTGQRPKVVVRQKAELSYICNALNFIFANNKVQRIADIAVDMILSYFDAYCATSKGSTADIMLSQQSLDNCVRHVSSFFANISSAYPTKININELLVYEDTRANRHSHRTIRRYIPRYVPVRHHSWHVKQLRDMPLAAAERLLELAWIHDPMIAFGIALQLYAGLRPGCVVNMRQIGSPVSSIDCIRLSYIGSAVSDISIDLTHEYVLRSDGVSVGKIKKERVVHVYKPFIPAFMEAYRLHMQLLSRKKCEAAYKPMFVCGAGKAMTYNTYAKRVKHLVYDHLKPELYLSEDPALSAFAQLLDSYRWSPHTLRHCFTVKLVLEGLDVSQIQYYRGDKSPESALTYLANKGELMRQVANAHQQAISTLRQQYIGSTSHDIK